MENWKFKKIRVKVTRQRAPHKVIHSKVIFGGRGKPPSYLFGKIAIDDNFKMVAMSVAGLGLVTIARVMSGLEIFGPGLTVFLVLMGSIFGSLVLATLVHGWLERHFAAFKPGKILGVGLLALASFIAHGQAVGEVNAIFEIDASALPHTTAVASAMVIGNWLSYVVLLPIFIVSVICFILFLAKSRHGASAISFAILLASLTWGALIFQQAGPELRRKSNLYQIALEMDFNKRSHCMGMPKGTEGILFIGPEQRRAIVAPEKIVFSTRGEFGALVPQVQVPTSFQIVDCK